MVARTETEITLFKNSTFQTQIYILLYNSKAKISEEKVCCMYLVPTLHHLDCDWFST